MARWLVRLTPDQVWVQVQARDIVLCWARHFTLPVSLSTQVYKWALANLINAGGLCCDGLASHPGGSRNIPRCFTLQKPG